MSEQIRLKQPSIPITNDLETILICAVRYACGRNTYMPGLVQGYIMSTFGGKLSENTLRCMQRDIEEQIDITRRMNLDHGSPGLFEHDLMFKLRAWIARELAAKEAKP